MPTPTAVNHGAVLRTLRELRGVTPPPPWKSVQHALDITDKEVRAYRWLSAAQIRAEHPRRPWKAIAADPSVDMTEATLKTNHAAAVLPSGQSWAEYVGAYQEAMRARLAALQAAEGVKAAENFFDGVKMLAEEVTQHVALLRDFRLDPPQNITVGFDAKGRPIHLDTTEQLVIAFPGVEGQETVERKRLTLGFASKLRQEYEATARTQRIVAWLLTGKKPEDEQEAAGAERSVSEESVLEQYRELEAAVAELRGYEEARSA